MRADFQPCAYIMVSAWHGTLYTGVTSHLIQRICQHRDGSFGGFTDRYGVKTLVWFELAGTMHAVITREKPIKNWQRKWKIKLIEAANPGWRDLAREPGLKASTAPLPSSPAPDPGRHAGLDPASIAASASWTPDQGGRVTGLIRG